MKTRRLVLNLLILIIILQSCNRVNVDINSLTGSFSNKNSVLSYDVELYTNQGEVKSKNEIENFMRNKELATDLSADKETMSRLYENIPESIELKRDGSFFAPYASGIVENIDEKRALLVGNDSIIIRHDFILEFQTQSNLSNYDVDFINQFPESVNCVSLPKRTGYSQVCKARFVIPIKAENNTTLTVPSYTVYYWSNRDGKHGTFTLADRTNFIKDDFYKSLMDGDTVLIQRKEHVFEKI
ncbi:hypothetical protein Pedsa_3124 [Pseudopedobacter saltans DSM 12145]|uniref:Lipoprotein n=1 Tax=Pseudopedobacter saltans (strain ATCC 51119 / DSM 12145 / JCM 21818 / CCUG 39354 / LMG 10337 / NBRC 100064 / NCIMB 13643) TaxID=762903 RepID=F0SAP2_PSESL|nr:hypothetical protein [Pseudopedobacter saltans]ADY53663.1 hypothetical protein Pedsa_3124 [Pseudopedobacter saltans DSM 12145]